MVEKEKKGSILVGFIWMFVISLLLFWLPIVGPLLAGVVGGKMSGGVGNALAAVFLPGIIFGVLLFFLATIISGIPLIGAGKRDAGKKVNSVDCFDWISTFGVERT